MVILYNYKGVSTVQSTDTCCAVAVFKYPIVCAITVNGGFSTIDEDSAGIIYAHNSSFQTMEYVRSGDLGEMPCDATGLMEAVYSSEYAMTESTVQMGSGGDALRGCMREAMGELCIHDAQSVRFDDASAVLVSLSVVRTPQRVHLGGVDFKFDAVVTALGTCESAENVEQTVECEVVEDVVVADVCEEDVVEFVDVIVGEQVEELQMDVAFGEGEVQFSGRAQLLIMND